MQLLKMINEGVAFLLELMMFFFLAFYGYSLGNKIYMKWLFAVLFILLAITLWGVFAAPRSAMRLTMPSRLLFELTMFAVTSLLMYKAGYNKLALVFLTICVVSEVFAYFNRQ